MKQDRIFVLLLALIVSVAFVLSVYFAFGSETPQIEIGNGSYQNDGYTDTTAYQDDPDRSSERDSSGRKDDEKDDSDSDDIVTPVSGEEPDYESEGERNKSESSSSESSQESSTSSDEKNQDYTRVFLLASQLESDYQIDVTVNTPQTPNSSGHSFEDSDTALRSLKSLRSVLRCGGENLFAGFSQKGYRISVFLHYSSSGSAVSMTRSGKSAEIRVDSGTSYWEYDFCTQYVRLAETIIRSSADSSILDREYQSLNPSGFRYGVPAFEYICSEVSETYFFSVEEQRSLSDDRRMLYTSYLMGEIPNRYLTEECPLYRKIRMIEGNISDYILS